MGWTAFGLIGSIFAPIGLLFVVLGVALGRNPNVGWRTPNDSVIFTAVFCGVGGIFLVLGLAFLALDLFVSCFARSQMTAAVAGVGVNLLVWLSDVLADAVTVRWISDSLNFISLYQRFAPFARGQLSLSNVLYNLLFMGVMLFLSVRVLDARRWSEA